MCSLMDGKAIYLYLYRGY